MALPDWPLCFCAAVSVCVCVCFYRRVLAAGKCVQIRRAFDTLMARKENPFFSLAYSLYTSELGYRFHKRQIKKAREKYPVGHSKVQATVINGIRIIPVPILLDNYSYIIVDSETSQAAVVDPADPQLVQAYLEAEGVTLEAVLCTHKHWDHSGGNRFLKKQYSNCKIFGNVLDGIPGLTHPLTHKEIVYIGKRLHFRAFATPGHTVGHMIYLLDGNQFGGPCSLFSGDLVFLAGCGRIFEGTASKMLASLDIVSLLPDDTLLWPGHEYAEGNLLFVSRVEPGNKVQEQKLKWVRQQRGLALCTNPSTIAEEKSYNPFLRTHCQELHQALDLHQKSNEDWTSFRARVLETLRGKKDIFKELDVPLSSQHPTLHDTDVDRPKMKAHSRT